MKATENITIQFPQYRPCLVRGYSTKEERRALFHQWATKQGTLPHGTQYTMVQALVEFENGSVEAVNPEDIRFVDSKHLFAQFYWGDEKVNG